MKTKAFWVEKLDLKRHPEGGFYKELYRSSIKITDDNLPSSFDGDRNIATSIYYLLGGKEVSHFHKIESDEIWYHHYGSPITIHVIDQDRNYKKISLGNPDEEHPQFQATIPANSFFGATVEEDNSYALAGCMVTPGFDFADFLIVDRDEMLRQYPEYSEIIIALTR
ncbi:MAG: cupin domain-containing protein [Bacteroidales bacterium]|nr:cupin domain-containing protein [Bacteroidales bacterium]